MSKKQEPRPAYHRRNDVRRLNERALGAPLIVTDRGDAYEVRTIETNTDPGRILADARVIYAGRFEVVYAYISGFVEARKLPSE